MIRLKKVLLTILDGVGIRDNEFGNAFKCANTPHFDYLMKEYPYSKLEASGPAVGLPKGQMGNSEVGHMNIGAGRVCYQPLELITKSIEDGSINDNEVLNEVVNYTKIHRTKIHLLGLISDGGIHSHIDHLMGIIDALKKKGVDSLYFHLFLDGRDTLPHSSYSYIKRLEDKLNEINGTIVTIAGRYYAMDRDNNWDRTKKAYDAMCYGKGEEGHNIKDKIDEYYKNGITDEFIPPTVFRKDIHIDQNDGIIMFNFRPDRLRQISYALTNPDFDEFERKNITVKFASMMYISDKVIGKQAFSTLKLDNTLGEYLSKKNIKQLRIAETEKYAHVTYFFDGGVEKELPHSKKILIPSPKVATYDLKPEMSAYEITATLLKEISHYDFIILNFANGDMVGHTGVFDKTVKAVEVLDECIGKLSKKCDELGYTMIITADHGNCDLMIDDDHNIITSHSTSKVPFILLDKNYHVKDGKLADIAPSILKLMNLDIPKEMTGDIIIECI